MTSIDYWPTLVGKLQKEWKIWDHLLRILGKNGYSPRLTGMFFNAVVQAVLIFRAETWVMIPNIIWALGGGVPEQDCMTDHGEAALVAIGRMLGLTSTGDGDIGREVRRD